MSSNAQDLMASLMASSGDGGAGNPATTNNTEGAAAAEGESDLFGDIPVADAPPAAASAPPAGPPPPAAAAPPPVQDPNLIVPPAAAAPPSSSDPLAGNNTQPPVQAPAQPPVQQQQQQSSLLMQSGLLGTATAGDPSATTAGGAAAATLTPAANGGDGLFASVDQEEAQQQAAAVEAERVQKEQQAAAQAQAEQQRLQMEQQQQQQQQLNDQMQSVYLGGGNTNPNVAAAASQPQQPYGSPSPYGQQQQQQAAMQQSHMVPPSPQGSPERIPSQPGYLTQPGAAAAAAAAAAAGTEGTLPPVLQQQPQQQQQMPSVQQQPPPVANNMDNFYRQQQQPQGGTYPPNQQQQQQQQDPQRYYHPTQAPSTLAGMHNAAQSPALGLAPTRVLQIEKPPPVRSVYDSVLVSEPLLIQPARGLLGALGQAAPHWSYQITTQFLPLPETSQQPPFWVVRRRFRHVVALEDRLHEEIPGAILPPRPDKHATRALEEATTHQSAEFAVQRAAELQVYLNQLISHPYAHNTHTLRLFLSLQDDVGTAWPEVSSNTLTRLANASVGAAAKVSEQTQATKFPWQDAASAGHVDDYGEDNAELLALARQEQVRMAGVLQAVPKLEGAIALLREHAERLGATGMEIGRLSKEVALTDTALGQPMDILSSGMLRSGRRHKRLSLELFAALHSYSQHYKSCRYEKMAFMDRRLAMIRRHKEQQKGIHPSQQQAMYQQQQQQQQAMMYQQPYATPTQGGGYPLQTTGVYPPQPSSMPPQMPPQQQQQTPYGSQPYMMDNAGMAPTTTTTDAWQECDEIGKRLKSEINRTAYQRRTDWFSAVKVVASSCKEATTETVAIWEAVKESFVQAFPQYEDDAAATAADPGGLLQSQVVVPAATADAALPPPPQP